ncbi:MAG: metallophosphoesterase [Rhizobiaceae bacterium]|nr:metallophosphoesterase [Rhizobiaceae bacterium]
MFRFAHISDVHLRPLPKPTFRQLASKRILGYINWKLNRRSFLAGDYLANLVSDMATKPLEQVVVTGDLVNISLPAEFINAAKFLKLLGEPEDVFAVCGNHDAYIPGSLRNAIRAWRPYVSGDGDLMQSAKEYPAVRIRGDIAFIACNSAEATLPFFATGYFRRKQAKRLAAILEQHKDKCRVIMIHHPPIRHSTPPHKRLIGVGRFQKVIAEHGAELVLHGHTHLATQNEIASPNGNVPVICVPAAGHARDINEHPAGRYNLFEIERVQDRWAITMEEYGMARGSDGIGLVARHNLS